MSFRSVAYFVAMLTLAPVGLLAAQEAAAPAGTTTAVESPVPTSTAVTPAPTVPRPQASPLFQVSDSVPTLGSVDNASMASGGKSHTIVISTLVLVLAVVILVLLIS